MNAYALLGAAFAVLAYIPLTTKVWKKILKQNFATYLLWGLLDVVAAGSIWMKGGNFLLPAIYVGLCCSVLAGILRTRTFSWGRDETITTAFVVLSIIVWILVSDEMATIVSTLGCVAAGYPQLKDLWKNPRGAPVLEYLGFTLANGLSTVAGHNWSIQERFYPAVCTGLVIVFVILGARKWSPKFRAQSA